MPTSAIGMLAAVAMKSPKKPRELGPSGGEAMPRKRTELRGERSRGHSSGL
jgi:hypothetical protein